MKIAELRVSVLICTKDRPTECLQSIEAVCQQTIPPSEIILADGSSNSDLETLVKGVTSGVTVQYIKTRPQLTYQRNTAASLMSGDVGLFIDDDVILDTNYIEEILNVYAGQPDVGGVAGFVTNVTSPASANVFFRKVFLLWSRHGDGHMQKSGYPTYLFDAKGPQQVDVFEGCNMSYSKEILQRFRFDENLKTNGAFEDHDFSYRVSRHHKLLQTPFARLKHVHSPISRNRLASKWELLTYWHYYFFKKNMPKAWGYVAAYLWSDIGNFCVAIKSCLTKRSSEQIRGILKGYARICRELFESRTK